MRTIFKWIVFLTLVVVITSVVQPVFNPDYDPYGFLKWEIKHSDEVARALRNECAKDFPWLHKIESWAINPKYDLQKNPMLAEEVYSPLLPAGNDTYASFSRLNPGGFAMNRYNMDIEDINMSMRTKIKALEFSGGIKYFVGRQYLINIAGVVISTPIVCTPVY